jgi:hypothetical protein
MYFQGTGSVQCIPLNRTGAQMLYHEKSQNRIQEIALGEQKSDDCLEELFMNR